MWRYYELLTDVQLPEIEKMKRDVASGAVHPMILKKDLARRIVADFRSAEAASKAGEDWAKQFQKDGVPADLECVSVEIGKIVLKTQDFHDESSYFPLQKFQDSNCTTSELRLVGVDRLLVEASFFSSRTEAGRKVKERAVHLGGQPVDRVAVLLCPKESLIVRVGKRIKKVLLTGN